MNKYKKYNPYLASTDAFIDGLYKRPKSLSKYLPYDEYLAREGIFINKDGSLGAVYEIELLEHETLVSEKVVEAVNALKPWFSLPENYSLQILYEQKQVSSRDRRFDQFGERYPKSHPVSDKLFNERIDSLRSACTHDGNLRPIERKAYLSIRYFSKNSKKSGGLFSKPEKTLFLAMTDAKDHIDSFLHVLSNIESSSEIKLVKLNADGLADLLRRFFNPNSYYMRDFAPVTAQSSLSEQLLYSSPILDSSGMEREGVKSRTLSLKTSPQFAYPGGMAYFTKLDFPFRIALNFSFPTKASTKKFFDIKEFFLQNTPSARAERQRQEVLEVQSRLAHDDRCLNMTFTAAVDGATDSEMRNRVRQLTQIFHNKLECEVIEENDIGFGLLLNMMPLCYSPKADYSTQRAIRIMRSDAVMFLPVFDSFRGLKEPLQLYLSRENNIVPFNLLENETSQHTVVLADSGSGKSAFVIDCIQSAKKLNPEPLVFVLDKGTSYKMLAEYFDADITEFKAGENSPFSPFRGVYDEEKFEFLTQFMLSCAKILSPDFRVQSEHSSSLYKALQLAYEKKSIEVGLDYKNGKLLESNGNEKVELNFDDVVAELAGLTSQPGFEKYAAAISELTNKLVPFYGDNQYANYFRPQDSDEKSKLFYIYDLEKVSHDPVLSPLVTMVVLEEIRQTINRPENQGRKAFLVLEEMQNLANNNPAGKKFIIDAAERFRKLNVWLIALTPRPQNYFETDAGQALWGVADNFVFLQMSADNVSYIQKHSALLDEAGAQIVKSLRTKKNHFAEVFYTNKARTKQGAFKYFQTPYDKWLAPTNAEDALIARAALAKYPDKWEALDMLVKQT